ncbi:MAG TPA: cupin domain-containing protein [Williamwhitmania sp.]|nr:cupin domain-containing protein [Williamwhitmania sp.]
MKMRVTKPSAAQVSKASSWGIWTKEISVFPWDYEEKETCYILEGSAEVTDSQGNKVTFGPGDWVEFEQGLTCIWKITKPIKKHYTFG